MLLYKDLQVLSRDVHKDLKLNPVKGYAFAAQMHWAPIAGVEFSQAALSHPIMFVCEGPRGQQTITPIILLGLSSGNNDCLRADSSWKPNSYIPAYVRRYPFIFSESLQDKAELSLCFDASFEGFNANTGLPLFNEDGTNGVLLQETINLLVRFNQAMEQTREFTEMLTRFNLLIERIMLVQDANGEMLQIPGFHVVDEERLSNLSSSNLEVLNQKGFLGWLFAHQMSLANLQSLLGQHVSNKALARSSRTV